MPSSVRRSPSNPGASSSTSRGVPAEQHAQQQRPASSSRARPDQPLSNRATGPNAMSAGRPGRRTRPSPESAVLPAQLNRLAPMGEPGGGDAFFGRPSTPSSEQRSRSQPALGAPGGGEAFFGDAGPSAPNTQPASVPSTVSADASSLSASGSQHGASGYDPEDSLAPPEPSDFSVGPVLQAEVQMVMANASAIVADVRGGLASDSESSRIAAHRDDA
jgi:hypothetical protein